MDVKMIIIVALVIFVILAIGGGIGFWIWIVSRPKKMTWQAQVYQIGDGVIKYQKIKDKYVRGYKLRELKPYTTDIIEKINKKSGATHYWLQKLKKPTPAVTADCVEVWGEKKKVVRVLLEGDSCTLLKSGYDSKIGSYLFRPMPHDRINMIKTEISERKARIEDTKDILTAITPFVVVGIAILGLVAMTYFIAQAGVKVASTLENLQEESKDAQIQIATMYAQAMNCEFTVDDRNINKEEPPVIPS